MTKDEIVKVLYDEHADEARKREAFAAADRATQRKYIMTGVQLLTPENKERLVRLIEALINENETKNICNSR